jgi:hypothetical protein
VLYELTGLLSSPRPCPSRVRPRHQLLAAAQARSAPKIQLLGRPVMFSPSGLTNSRVCSPTQVRVLHVSGHDISYWPLHKTKRD